MLLRTHLVLAAVVVILTSLVIPLNAHAEAPRIAVLPTFSDFEWSNTPWRKALSGFDARLQAELISAWDTEVLSRSGLSAIVFEQKLRQAKGKEFFQVLPAGVLLMSVFDFQRKQLRVHVCPVKSEMKLGVPKVFAAKMPAKLSEDLPHEVALFIASELGLAARVKDAAVSSAVPVAAGLRCAVLDPVCEVGMQDELPRIAPVIRAALEQILVSKETGLELLERSGMASLIEERTLSEVNAWNLNAASSLGLLAGADLILVPFIHFQKASQINTSLFALDTRTGRMLACRMWSGGTLDAPPSAEVKGLIDDALRVAKRAKDETLKDDPSMRHAEAEFLIGLRSNWLGLRQETATTAHQASRFGDAAICLAQDDLNLMRRAADAYYFDATPALMHPLQEKYEPNMAWVPTIRKLRKSGQLADIHAESRRVFELPLVELSKVGTDIDRDRLARFYLLSGDAQKALDVISAGSGALKNLASNEALSETTAKVLINLGRYQECVDFILSQEKFSTRQAMHLVDSLRALGDFHREFEMLWINRHIANKSGDRLVRLLELGIKENRASDVLGHVMSWANAWTINQKMMRMPIARARMAVGQKEIAISDAQCFMLAARREGDEASEQQMKGLLTELGAPPLDSLPTPREFVTLPSSCSINLMHDETITPQHASEVALQLAGFWGCAVKIWPVKLEVKKLASYNRLNQAVDGNDFAKMLSGVTWPQDQTLGTVFLTHHKLISESRGNVGDIYSSHSGVTTVLSDHYFQKYASLDKRPLTVLNAVAAGYLPAVWSALWVEAEKDGDPALSFSPVPPDVFASNGNLIVNDRELGISLRTGALLKRIGSSALIEYVQNLSLVYFKRESERLGPDSALAEVISQQLSRTTPVITKIPESTK